MKAALGILRLACVASWAGLTACASGTAWVNEPQQTSGDEGVRLLEAPAQNFGSAGSPSPAMTPASIGGEPHGPLAESDLADAPGQRPVLALQDQPAPTDAPPDARLVGVFRNTYYDFPAEADFSGPPVAIMSNTCAPIRKVPRGFYEALCVQGSGTLTTGATVSFAKRDCGCAEVCPRTGQKICFDELDRAGFPWGRGALGKPITPLRTVAVDSSVIALGTALYIAEYDGVPRGPGGASHDGCFVAEDRGLKVQGEHVDIFTGNPRMTAHLNGVIPSNAGVHVYVGTARCQ